MHDVHAYNDERTGTACALITSGERDSVGYELTVNNWQHDGHDRITLQPHDVTCQRCLAATDPVPLTCRW